MRGRDAKLYVNTGTDDEPTWLEVERAVDINDGRTKNEYDDSSRQSIYDMAGNAGKALEVGFGYRYKKGQDLVYDELEDMWGGDAVQIAVTDGPIATVGTRGIKFFAELFTFNHAWPLKDGATIECVAKPVEHFEDDEFIEPEAFETEAE